jgi:hypothetical protein
MSRAFDEVEDDLVGSWGEIGAVPGRGGRQAVVEARVLRKGAVKAGRDRPAEGKP